MSTASVPRLRYFDCRSRGQGLRFALASAGVAFEEVRVPTADLAAFRERAEDPAEGGPFGSLPVLEWGGPALGQALAIASHLADRLDHDARGLALESRAFRAMLTSAAHLDAQVPYSGLLWLDPAGGEERVMRVADGLLTALDTHLRRLERLHAERCTGPFFGGEVPVVADAFVYESLSRGLAVFGACFAAMLESRPCLRRLHDQMAARPAIAILHEAGQVPRAVTASPNEEAVRALLASGQDPGPRVG